MALVGGGYNALCMKKSKKPKGPDSVQADGRSGDKKPSGQASGQPAARREAKVLSLKESNAVQGKKDYKPPVVEETKKEVKKVEEAAPKKTHAEEKKEREKTDRHVPRSGKSPARGSKGDDAPAVIAADEATAATDDPAAAAEQQRDTVRLSKEEEDAKKQREEEERQITYDDYVKQQKEKQAGLPQAQAVRKVDAKAFAKFATVTKGGEQDDSALSFGKKKEEKKVAPPPKPAGKAAKGKGQVAKPDPKAAVKSKPQKSNELLSFTVTDQAPKPRKGGKGGGKGGGGGAPPRGGPEWDSESKVDSDGVTRTKREFVAKYGGFSQWDKAAAVGGAAPAAAPASTEPEAESW